MNINCLVSIENLLHCFEAEIFFEMIQRFIVALVPHRQKIFGLLQGNDETSGQGIRWPT